MEFYPLFVFNDSYDFSTRIYHHSLEEWSSIIEENKDVDTLLLDIMQLIYHYSLGFLVAVYSRQPVFSNLIHQ